MGTLIIVGRIILGGYFLMMGINHFKKIEGLTAYARSKHVPAPSLAVITTGLLMILGGLSILLWQYVLYGILLLIIFLFFTSIIMHNFWKDTGEHRMVEMRSFMSNMALLGALLILITFT